VAKAPARTWTTTRDTADRLGICRQTARNWVRAGRLDGEKVGDRVLVSEASVAALERPGKERRP
jgi:excisionase family DNA binding protein